MMPMGLRPNGPSGRGSSAYVYYREYVVLVEYVFSIEVIFDVREAKIADQF